MYAVYKSMPSQNPLITEKIVQRNKQKHKDNLKSIKCSVDNRPPRHWKSRPKKNLKKEQLLEERYAQIERDNRLLLDKMAGIMRKSNKAQKELAGGKRSSPSHVRSLNVEFRHREVQRINQKNLQILRNLQSVTPTYSALRWEQERKQQEAIVRNIVVHKRDDLPTLTRPSTSSRRRRAKSAKKHRTGRDQANSNNLLDSVARASTTSTTALPRATKVAQIGDLDPEEKPRPSTAGPVSTVSTSPSLSS